MNSGLNPADPTLVAAFRSALLHQGAIALAIVVFLLLLWATARAWRGYGTTGTSGTGEAAEAGEADVAADRTVRASAGARAQAWAWLRDPSGEAAARTLLRVGFGLLWILDGFLQAQPKMAAGLPSLVIQPTAANSPTWVQHVVNWGGTIWSYHPIQAGAASVWIQIGIGAWLLVAARGVSSRLAALASVGWGLVVWVFGESFGGIFAPGLTILFGAPGAVLIYAVAGALIALPDRAWRGPRQRRLTLGRLLLAGIGLFFIGMAVLQAWPGRGFWQGGKNGTLTGMIQSMTGSSQPHTIYLIVSGASSFTSAHGWAVNLFAVVALAAMGVVFLTGGATPFLKPGAGRPWLIRYAVWFGVFFCLADWVLVQDLGFLGGLGTDPNSMIPLILLFVAGYLALSPAEQEVRATEESPAPGPGWRERVRPETVRATLASASAQSLAAVSAIVVIVIGAAPMAAAAVNRTADPILAEAIAGASAPLDIPAPAFQLTDQNGRTVTLASLRGKVVVMTFLDPVCTTDCPIIGQEFRQAGVLLGAADKNVELVAVVANPTYYSTAATQAFDTEEGLNTVPNWLYLTGSLSQLKQMWSQYGITVENLPAGAMSAHTDTAVVIDRHGAIRQELSDDPGPGTTSTKSSFAALLAQYARQALAGS
jgi:cytochrome oxidase Cu insertion factor (SCO1/SenC/PrrC family)